jgi:hypothetical protein
MSDLMREAGLSDIDANLLEEAFRRACKAPLNEGVDQGSLLAAILDEARRGTRHMHGLVGAAARVKQAA